MASPAAARAPLLKRRCGIAAERQLPGSPVAQIIGDVRFGEVARPCLHAERQEENADARNGCPSPSRLWLRHVSSLAPAHHGPGR